MADARSAKKRKRDKHPEDPVDRWMDVLARVGVGVGRRIVGVFALGGYADLAPRVSTWANRQNALVEAIAALFWMGLFAYFLLWTIFGRIPRLPDG
jgi:hypothetical protein